MHSQIQPETLTTTTANADFAVDEGLTGWLERSLRSRWILFALLACVLLLRLPSIVFPHELNVDESNMTSQAMKFLVDPRPWIAIDPTSVGPLDAYLITAVLWLGFKPGYVLIHVLASLLVCLQISVAYLTLRRLKSHRTGLVGACLMVLLYGLTSKKDFLHYAGEWLPTLFCTIGFYAYTTWLQEPERIGKRLGLLFAGGLFLGAAPWCKLQASPITLGLGLLFLAAILFRGRPNIAGALRAKELIAFSTGAVLPACIFLTILAKTGAVGEFWNSYIRGNLVYAGPATAGRGIENFIIILLTFALHEPVVLALLGVAVLLQASPVDELRLLLNRNGWAIGGVLAYAAAALFAIARVTHPFHHQSIFLVPPLVYLAALPFPASREIAAKRGRPSVARLVFGTALVLVFATIAGIRYINMTRAIHKMEMQANQNPRTPENKPYRPDTVKMGDLLLTPLGSHYWTIDDSHERIAAVVKDIQGNREVRSLAIWGWVPGVYVLSGMPPATRDPVLSLPLRGGEMRDYYRERYVSDLRQHPPDLFIDAVTTGAFMWWPIWTEDDGYESVPEVKKFIDDNYVKVDELTLVKETKAVRFFARRGLVGAAH